MVLNNLVKCFYYVHSLKQWISFSLNYICQSHLFLFQTFKTKLKLGKNYSFGTSAIPCQLTLHTLYIGYWLLVLEKYWEVGVCGE